MGTRGMVESAGGACEERLEQQGAEAGNFCAQREYGRPRQGMVKVAWTVLDERCTAGRAGRAFCAVEGSDSRWASGRWHRVGESGGRSVLLENCGERRGFKSAGQGAQNGARE